MFSSLKSALEHALIYLYKGIPKSDIPLTVLLDVRYRFCLHQSFSSQFPDSPEGFTPSFSVILRMVQPCDCHMISFDHLYGSLLWNKNLKNNIDLAIALSNSANSGFYLGKSLHFWSLSA
jgi:hypothetical protein